MSEIKFGYCDIITTPSTNIGLEGYQSRWDFGFGNSGVMDDLYARALSLSCSDGELMLVTVDICGINESLADNIRKRIAENLNLPLENIMLCASHTHSGPVSAVKPNDRDSDIARTINSYTDDLTNKIVTICLQARSNQFKGKIYSATYSASLGYNRRHLVKTESGENTIEMLFTLWINPAHETNGQTDPNIPVLMIERIDEDWYDSYFSQAEIDRVILFNVPIHPVVLGSNNRYVSADYPGSARKCIENTLGYGTKAMFLLGACGNVNPLFACQNNPKAVEVVGNAIGYGICAALSCKKEIEFDGLKAISEDIKLNEGARFSRAATQVFKIGKAAIAAISAECFTEMGIDIRNNSCFEQTLIATNSNGGGGYIPTSEAYEINGSYEVPIAKNNGYEKGLLEKIAQTVTKNLQRLSK